MDEFRETLDQLPAVDGVNIVDILGLPRVLRSPLTACNRKRSMSLPEFARELRLDVRRARAVTTVLVAKGYLTVNGDPPDEVFRLRFVKRSATRSGQGDAATGLFDALSDD